MRQDPGQAGSSRNVQLLFELLFLSHCWSLDLYKSNRFKNVRLILYTFYRFPENFRLKREAVSSYSNLCMICCGNTAVSTVTDKEKRSVEVPRVYDLVMCYVMIVTSNNSSTPVAVRWLLSNLFFFFIWRLVFLCCFWKVEYSPALGFLYFWSQWPHFAVRSTHLLNNSCSLFIYVSHQGTNRLMYQQLVSVTLHLVKKIEDIFLFLFNSYRKNYFHVRIHWE